MAAKAVPGSRSRSPSQLPPRSSSSSLLLLVCLYLLLSGSSGQHAYAHAEPPPPASPPSLSVVRWVSPAQGSVVTGPLIVEFGASEPCRSMLGVDGLLVDFFSHELDGNMFFVVQIPHLSREEHVLSLDLVDEDGEVTAEGPRLTVKLEHSSPEEPPDPEGWEQEEVVEYNPFLSQEELARAEVVDGWLLVNEQVDWKQLDPSDECEDVGWRSRERPRRIWDAFQLFNELDMLEVRLNELDDVVHMFVLVEATRTHSNAPKKLFFEENKHRFQKFLHKIRHVVVDDLPYDRDPWVLENFQRNAMTRGLHGIHPTDLIVIADVDEIPVPYVLNMLSRCNGPSSPTWLYSRFFNFKFQWEFQGQWKHPQVIRAAQVDFGDGRGVKLQQVRMGKMGREHTAIESGAWHCSFFSNVSGVMEKVKAFTHQELNTAEWLDAEKIEEAINSGLDYFNSDRMGNRKKDERHGGLHMNPSCHGLPRYVLAHSERFAHWLPDCVAAHGEDTVLQSLAFPTCSSRQGG